jgi:transcriptional regulator with XRE-family HTH domain
MSTTSLTPYGELADVLKHLPVLVRENRRRRGLSLRAAAQEAGVSFSTVARAESGEDCALSSAIALLNWLGGDHV